MIFICFFVCLGAEIVSKRMGFWGDNRRREVKAYGEIDGEIRRKLDSAVVS